MENAMKKEDRSTDSTRMAGALVSLVESLTQAMETEMEYLSKQDYVGVESVRETKARLVRDYQNNVRLLAQKPDLLHGAPADIRARLRGGNEKLESVSQRNAAALRLSLIHI